jgi:type III restriction enzyme
VGKQDWPRDRKGSPIYAEGFEELAKKLERPLTPQGRDVRCIVSVGMLTEGWDCNTVTHIVGLRPFMSQLLCEQVVGRGLRRASYDIGDDGLATEEVAKVLGVPFEVIPMKASKGGSGPRVKRHHVHSVPQKSEYEITFPRVERYRQAVRNRVTVDWKSIARTVLDPSNIPPEADMKGLLPTDTGRPSLTGPGRLENVTLNPYRKGRRLQELAFDLSRDLVRVRCSRGPDSPPPHVLFPQIAQIALRYLEEKVEPVAPAQKIDVFLSPYYLCGWVRPGAQVSQNGAGGNRTPVPWQSACRLYACVP